MLRVPDHDRNADDPKPADAAKRKPVSKDALWLWGRLRDFERDGLLAKDPGEVLSTMTPWMLADIDALAPRVAAWLSMACTADQDSSAGDVDTATEDAADVVTEEPPRPRDRVYLPDLKPGMCRWPIGGDPREDKDFGFCGQPRVRGSYCGQHAELAFVRWPHRA